MEIEENADNHYVFFFLPNFNLLPDDKILDWSKLK